MEHVTMQDVEKRLAKLLKKLTLPEPITVTDIKDSIWNAQKSGGSFELLSMLIPYAKDHETVQEVTQVAQDAWNYFPHRMLGGKSPNDLVKEYQETGTVDQRKQKPLAQKGKLLRDVFADRYPKTIVFEKLDEDTWGWKFPKLYHELTESLWELEERRASQEMLEKELSRMIRHMPELFDAINLLAKLYGVKREFGLANALYEQSISRARTYIPSAFIHGQYRIIWAYMENRPFLRLLAGYAGFVEQLQGPGKAIPLYEEILSFNPNDNQGVRAILATAYLKTDQPEKVIELSSQYPDDAMAELVMGTVLAYIRLGEYEHAKKFLAERKDYHINLIKELLKPSHLPPPTLMPDRVTHGGEDEAFYFWQAQGKLWEQTTDALDFLRSETKDIQSHIVLLTENDVLRVDFFHDFLFFLNLLKEHPIKLTATGNLSLKNINPFLKRCKTLQPVFKSFEEHGWTIRKEEELGSLHVLRIMTDIMHLTYKRHNTLLLSKNGKAFLENLTRVDQFRQVFDYYRHRCNWAYYAITENDSLLAKRLQGDQKHICRILKDQGTEWVEYVSFCKKLNEELNLQPFLVASYATPEEILDRRIHDTLFTKFLSLFGCVELETKQIDQWRTDIIRFRLTKIGQAMIVSI